MTNTTSPGTPVIIIITTMAALIASSCAVAEVNVNVDAGTNIIIDNEPKIDSKLFGITAFQGFPTVVADMDYRWRVAALRCGCFRFPGNVSWFAPDEYRPSAFATKQALRKFRTTLLFGSRYAYGRFVDIVDNMGAEPMVSLGSPPPYLRQSETDHPSDFAKWAEYCAAYIGLWKKADPDLRYVQIWNEPNSSWFNDPRVKNNDDMTAAQSHINMANQVATAINKKYPDIRIGGPVFCWPPGWPPNQKHHEPWYTWNSWTLPWLEQTKETIDFFDFHTYDVSPDDFTVQTEMLYNQAILTQGRKLPISISESGYHLQKEEFDDPEAIWRKRFLPHERYLLRAVIPQADKIFANLYHDLHARHHTLLPRGAFDVDPMYWLLWILRDLRGWRVKASSDARDIVTYATMKKDRVTTVIFNDSSEKRTVNFNIQMPTGYATGPRVRAVGYTDGMSSPGRMEINDEIQRDRNTATGPIQLPAFATVSVNFHMQNWPHPRRRHIIREYFGDRTVRFIRPEESVTVGIDVPENRTDAVVGLRLGLLGPQENDAIAATFNGDKLTVQPTPVQEISLEPSMVEADNRLELAVSQESDNRRLALGFASIITEIERPWTPSE